MAIETRLFINNEYVESSSGATFSVYNPADDSLITDQVYAATSADVDKAVDAASNAFKTWKATLSAERSAIMLKFADLVEQNMKEISKLDTMCMGAPSSFALMVAQMLVDSFRYYAGLTDKVHGKVFNEDGDGMLKFITYDPIGVCAGISAWNSTLLSVSCKIAPAVAMGNTCIHKTSEKSPLSTICLGSLFKQAGFPPGVVNLLSGAGETGGLLASHMGIQKISFTGSTEAGRKVQIAAAQSNLKHVTLELGGKSASITFDDANLENAIKHNSHSFLMNNAQVCSAASRVFVHEDIAPQFIEGIKMAFEQSIAGLGDPTLPQTFFGPMADKLQHARVTEYIQGAIAEGIEVLTGGQERPGPGRYITSTVFLNPGLDSRIYKEEIFGPVLIIKTFKTEDEAIKLANDTPSGLSGIIFTSNISRGLKVASRLDVGTLSINGAHLPMKQTGWGGWKQSGYGRESGLEAIDEFLQSKSIHVHLNV